MQRKGIKWIVKNPEFFILTSTGEYKMARPKKMTKDRKKIQSLEYQIDKMQVLIDQQEHDLKFRQRQIEELKTKSELNMRAEVRDGCAQEHIASLERQAITRAHTELHRVKSTEANAAILQRAIGDAQGILALVFGPISAPLISLYPADEEKELLFKEEQNRNRGW